MIKGLGLPYKGSKRNIIDKISRCFPKADNFYDVFGGGFSVTAFMLANHSRKYKNFYANDIKKEMVELFKKAIEGQYDYSVFKPRWVSRKEFDELRSKDGYIRVCWSFGNNGRSYLYDKQIEAYKKELHQAIVFEEIVKDINFEKWPDKCKSIYQRRIYLKRIGEKEKNRQRHLESLEKLQELKILKKVSDKLTLTNKSYEDIIIEKNSVVYCDPPYEGTEGYQEAFKTKHFLDWANDLQEIVFISEYNIDDKRFSLFNKYDHKSSLSATNNKKKVKEKLYINSYGKKKLMS